SKINQQEISIIHLNLSKLMDKEKLFKNPELTLSDLAQKLLVHPNTLSQVINSVEQKNFYDYINLQRIEEFKSLAFLPENKEYTLLSLAFECGFNSKSSFNRNFKKATNLSPSEYLNQANIHLY
ncbi:MAG: helix-turn-helix domain-containing protein, partial [Ferruginibacter sp.]